MKLFGFFLFFSLMMVSSATFAQENIIVYDNNSEIRNVGNFNGIEVSGGISLYLSQGPKQAVAISVSNSEYLNKIKTEVKNNKLRIYVESGMWNKWNWGNTKIKAYVTASPSLESLSASGASAIKAATELNATAFSIDISGASNFTGKVKSNNIKMEVSGASSINIEGAAENANLEASGASSIKGFNFLTSSCKAEASGASSINITVNKELKPEASGASNIFYKGNAIVKGLDISGASSVKKRD